MSEERKGKNLLHNKNFKSPNREYNFYQDLCETTLEKKFFFKCRSSLIFFFFKLCTPVSNLIITYPKIVQIKREQSSEPKFNA